MLGIRVASKSVGVELLPVHLTVRVEGGGNLPRKKIFRLDSRGISLSLRCL